MEKSKTTPKTRTKVVFLNLLTDIVPKILVCILGIIKAKLFLNILGQEQLGMYQLYGQILAYLVLAEGGVGTAVLYRLFKLVDEGDQKKINDFMSSSKTIFRIVTTIMLIVGTIITLCMPLFVKDYQVSTFFLCSTFFVYMISEIITYATVPERSRFDADQKKYIPNLIAQSAQLVRIILEIIIIIFTKNLYCIVFLILAINLLSYAINKLIYKKYYGVIKPASKKDYSVVKDCRHLTVNTIANLISSNIDIILISKFIGLSSVVIYSAYNYIVDNIRKIIESFMGSTMSSIANIILKSKTKAYEIFSEYTAICYYVATILCIPIFMTISPFIKIWYEGDIFTSRSLALLFSALLFLNIIKIPTKTFTFAAGKFQLIKKYVIYEILLNLVLSVIMVNIIGIPGVLIATVISYVVCDFFPKTIIVLKNIVDGNKLKFFENQLVFIIVAIVNGLITLFVFKSEPTNLPQWIINAVLIFAFNALLTTGYYVLAHKIDFIARLKAIKGDHHE